MKERQPGSFLKKGGKTVPNLSDETMKARTGKKPEKPAKEEKKDD